MDSSPMTLDQFCERWMDMRDFIAYKKIKGEPLNASEEIILELLNRIYEQIEPLPPGIPPEVMAVVHEVLRSKNKIIIC